MVIKLIFYAVLVVLTILFVPEKTPSANEKDNPVSVLGRSTTDEAKGLVLVVKVVDGDTVWVELGGARVVVRLIGVDTPELGGGRKPVECFANEASGRAGEVLEGKKVRLESDETQGDKDRYGRWLRYVFFADGTNFNELMIRDGYAHEYTYKTPYKYMEEFKKAEKEAREAGRGLWAEGACGVM